ncbi:hypothetical protein SUGI_0493260 [Cryptomeria japonica]|nr:hypothetical protein SUGI_0493260 [Cryptomeria japonica]
MNSLRPYTTPRWRKPSPQDRQEKDFPQSFPSLQNLLSPMSYSTRPFKDPIPSGGEIREALVNTVPGDSRILVMAAHQAEGLKQWFGNEGWAVDYCATQARDACVRVLGKQREHIIEVLIIRHANSTIF